MREENRDIIEINQGQEQTENNIIVYQEKER